jgi:hypothetical protein
MAIKKRQSAADPVSAQDPRRRLLRALFGAGAVTAALPGEWIRPVVKQVVLPAHAGVSPCEDDDSDSSCDDLLPDDVTDPGP